MQRYFIQFSYDGSNYHGWQIQPNGITVQEVLEKALSTLLRTKISVIGAGRTDSGVHARTMVAHFDFTENSIDCKQLCYKLNRILPRDVAVTAAYPVNNELHARFSATSRTYHYYMHHARNPFQKAYSCEMPYALNYNQMNEAASYLIGERNFKCFCKAGGDNKTTICNLTEAQWVRCNTELSIYDNTAETESWCFVITANRFLRNMVRAVVGTLVEVGRGRLSIDDFCKIVDTGTRSDAGESMPGNALFLWNIEYPSL